MRSGLLAFVVLCSLASSAAGINAQPALRREAAIQPVALVEKGDLLIGVGAGYETDIEVPLIAITGDMTRLGVLQLAFGVADGVLIAIHGDAYRALSVERRGELPVDSRGVPLVVPDEGLADDKSTGAGDFRVGIAFRVFGGESGPFIGGRFQFNIPDSNQAEGLGTNSMMMRASLLGGYGGGPLHLTADLGLAILEAPAESFEQNDVVAYAAEVLYTPLRGRPLRLFAGVDGRASTRSRVPVGTEDQGRARLGSDYRVGRWLVDIAGHAGYAGTSPSWGVEGGIAVLIGDR